MLFCVFNSRLLSRKGSDRSALSFWQQIESSFVMLEIVTCHNVGRLREMLTRIFGRHQPFLDQASKITAHCASPGFLNKSTLLVILHGAGAPIDGAVLPQRARLCLGDRRCRDPISEQRGSWLSLTVPSELRTGGKEIKREPRVLTVFAYGLPGEVCPRFRGVCKSRKQSSDFGSLLLVQATS